MQILQPLAIQHIGLAARHVMHVLCIDQVNVDTPRLQDLKQRYPVDSRRLHRHGVDATDLEPIGQPMEIFCKAGKRPYRIGVPVGGNGDKYFCSSDVYPRGIGSHLRQTPIQLTMLFPSSHGALPDWFWRQRARYAKTDNLSSGIIATGQVLPRVTNVIAHEPGIKLLKGFIRKHHWGYDLHLPLPSPVSYHRARTTSVFLKFLLVIVLVRRLEILLSRGGVDAQSRRSCEATISRRRGGAGQDFLTGTTPSAPQRRLRSVFLVSRPPLLG